MTASTRRTASVTIRGPLARDDLVGLFARTCALLHRERPEVLRCELADVAPDAVAVDALARLALAARRSGCSVRLRGACAELHELLAFAGLADVLSAEPAAPSPGKLQRHAEQRE